MTRSGTGRRKIRLRRLGTATALTGTFLLTGVAFAAYASAHVKVESTDAVQGGSGVITFRVPSESATASTKELLITFPSATPFTSVDTQPKAGWKATVTTKPLPRPMKDDDGNTIADYVSQVDYKATAPSAAIPPGEFEMFNLSVGPFPTAPSISFGALQTYSDGSTVNWDEKSANGTEPEHPAPVLQLTAPAAGQAAVAPAAGSGVTASAQALAEQTSTGGGSPSWPGIVGLVAGIVALLVSLAALTASRSRGKASPSA